MRNIVEIRAAKGDYFAIGRDTGGYYIKNKYTEIPNEFGLYDTNDVRKLFDELCSSISKCNLQESLYPIGDEAQIYVEYDDKSIELYKCPERSGITIGVIRYSDLFDDVFFSKSEVLTLDHLRRVCRDKEESYSVFLYIMKCLNEEDGVRIEGAPYSLEMNELGMKRRILAFNADRTIGETKVRLKYIELLKAYGVRVMEK